MTANRTIVRSASIAVSSIALSSIVATSTTLSLVTLLGTPLEASSQLPAGMAVPDPVRVTKVDRCDAGSSQYEAEWTVMLASSGLAPQEARAALAELRESLELEAQGRPTDVDLQYLLAAVIGTSAEFEEGREAIKAAKDLHARTMTVLALDPGHPGAQHLLGRLNHAVMSMGRVQRFLATKVLGGSEFSGASWDEAQSLLESAAKGDPCRADHHYELARLYLDRGDAEVAYERLEQLLRLDLTTARDRLVMERARGLLEELSN